ncbi:MAG: hypothetical protein ACREEM_29215 [Blastocatellia bacterium]
MTTITLELPDNLAKQLEAIRGELPSLLTTVLGASSAKKISQTSHTAAIHPVYREMLDFLATSPPPQQIIDFKISATSRERLEELLEKNREEGSTEEEIAELDAFELVHHSMVRLKAQARSLVS